MKWPVSYFLISLENNLNLGAEILYDICMVISDVILSGMYDMVFFKGTI